MADFLYDTFTEASTGNVSLNTHDGETGANWVSVRRQGITGVIFGNRLSISGASGTGFAFYRASGVATPDLDLTVRYFAKTAQPTLHRFGFWVRGDDALENGVWMGWNKTGWAIERVDNGTVTQVVLVPATLPLSTTKSLTFTIRGDLFRIHDGADETAPVVASATLPAYAALRAVGVEAFRSASTDGSLAFDSVQGRAILPPATTAKKAAVLLSRRRRRD